MKRILRILALCLALVMLAACAGHGGGDAGDFGNSDKTFPAAQIPITDCSGDTDFIEATSCYFTTLYGEPQLGVCFSGEHDAAVTVKAFEDGRQTSPGVWFDDAVTMERSEGGEWVELGNIRPYKPAATGGEPSYVILPGGDSRLLLPFPIHESGTYRLTYKMRESTGDYSTGDTLYSISHTVTVPDATDSRFDIVSAEPDASGVHIAIRSNTPGAALYLDRARGTIEKKSDGGEYTNLTDTDAGSSLSLLPEDDVSRFYDAAAIPNEFGYDDLFMLKQPLTLEDAGEYRLTMFFTQKPDGTGEQYTLRLNLKFGE